MTHDSQPKKTALYDEHIRLGGKVIEFGGWMMPVQYNSIMDEHNAVRNAVGVFDISHMGEFFVRGAQAKAWLNHLLANNVEKIAVSECQYTFLLNERGGVIDDLIVYHFANNEYLLVVNASKIDEDFSWIHHHEIPGVKFENKSDDYAGLAIQGPKAPEVFAKIFGDQTLPERNHVATVTLADLANAELFVARTGYTGEDGFELFFPNEFAVSVWNRILEAGAKPCGLGARDTLRLEACYPLNGNDLSPDHTPLEAGLGFFVNLEKEDFIGRNPLLRQKQQGLKRRLVAFKMKEKSPPPRAHYPIYKNGEMIGDTASGSLSPTLGIGIGMAYLPIESAKVGEEIEIDIRGRRFAATIEKKPLYKKS